MLLEQALTIETLADFHNLGAVNINSTEDGAYRVEDLQSLSKTGVLHKFQNNGKSFSQCYSFIRCHTFKD